MNSSNCEVAIFGRQTLGLKARGGGAVPVVADSRSEELTDGQETPFLPPPGMSYKSSDGQLARVPHQLTDCVCVSKEHPLGTVKSIKNRQ